MSSTTEGGTNTESQLRVEQTEELIVSAESDQKPVLSVVLPTLNEEQGITECIGSIKSAVHELGITTEIIVSDNSDDLTPEIADEMGAIVVEPEQLGYGSAYRHGFRFARGDYIAIGDADTTYDFEELPKLLDCMKDSDADMVLGSRLAGEITPGSMPVLHQYVGNPVLTRFLNLFYNAGVTDAHSGFRVLTRDALNQLDLNSSGMEFASEMIMDAAAKGLTIEEVPITYHKRKGDATLDSFQDGWRHVKFMLINAPAYLFSIPAVLCAVTGITLMVFSLYDFRPGGIDPGPNIMVAGSLLTVCGVQIGTLAIFSSIASNPIQKLDDSVSNWILNHFRLKHGATFGLCMLLSGGILANYLLFGWVSQSTTVVPGLRLAIIAFTAIVLGVQIIFSSFFFSAIAE